MSRETFLRRCPLSSLMPTEVTSQRTAASCRVQATGVRGGACTPSDCSDTAHGAEGMALWIEGLAVQASVPEFRSPASILKVGCVWWPSIISVLEAETGNP